MTTSSQQMTYSASSLDDLLNTITITVPAPVDTIYIDTANMNSYTTSIGATGLTGALTGVIGSSYSINDTATLNQGYQFNWGEATEWLDSFPDWQRVQDMCKKYPGLEIAMRNFQTVYTLVKDDYDHPKDEK